jgi:CarboxypepD_reg-like domain
MNLFYPKYFYALILLLISSFSFAQIPILERPISLKVTNEKTSTVLDIIAKQGNFSFSYNSEILDGNNRISIWIVDKPVREVLNQIFKGSITFKATKNYVIFQKAEVENATRSFILSGYIFDTETDRPLQKVSIYDKKSLLSTITNKYGFYRIKLSVSSLPIKLTISKPGYYQEEVFIKNSKNNYLDIGISPFQDVRNINSIEDNSMELMDSVRNLSPIIHKEIINNQPQYPDITDEILFPSSPVTDSTLYQNSFDKFKKKLGKVLVNRSQRVNAQNVRDSLSRKFQFSLLPFLGTNRLLSGSITNDYSVNLLMGYAGGVNRLEIGGLINGVRKDVKGLQIAGIGNIVGGNILGGQISSIFNVAGNVENGIQISGLFNTIIKESGGWQISFVNFAHKVVKGGKQIGFINIADSTETTPIGFLSFVGSGNGYKRLELIVDENLTGSFSFKTGVRKFYNIIALHYNFTRKQEIFGIGYGVGRAYKLGNSWMMNTDLTTNLLVEYDDISPNVASLYKLDISFEKQIARNAAITFGPSLKYMEIDDYNISTRQVKPFYKIPNYQTLSYTGNTRLWIGFQMGLRIRSK